MKRFPSRLAVTLSIVACCTALHTTASTATAGVFSFGSNSAGKTGLGISSGSALIATPIVTTNLVGRNVVQVAAGHDQSLLLADDGSVFSFGWSAMGATGLGTLNDDALIATPIVTTNLGGRKIKQVAAGSEISLLLADDGSVFSFGSYVAGALGLGTTSGPYVSVATPIDTANLGSRKIIQMAAGGWHSLLLADDGSVFSCGDNNSGQTGLGTTSGNTWIATPIASTNLGGRKIVQVAAGDEFSLLLADDGGVFSFGRNNNGQLGLGTTSATAIATPIVSTNLGSRKITQVAAAFEQSLLLADDGSVFSFGSNGSGQLGLGTTGGNALVATPIDTSNLGSRKITEVAAGRVHSLLLAEDGSAFSFGNNLSRQLGLGSTSNTVPVPTPIDTTNLGGLTITQLDAGGFFSLLIAEPRLPGDYNKDGIVDGADYVVWRKTGGQTGASLAADGDQDHQFDADDYNVWRANFGQTRFTGSGSALPSAESLSASVPEPDSALLLSTWAVVVALMRRRVASRVPSTR